MVRKTVVIYQVAQAAAALTWNFDINVPFAASKVTVRQISFSDNVVQANMGAIYRILCDLVPDRQLGIAVDTIGYTSNPSLEIDLGGQTIGGRYSLTLMAGTAIGIAVVAAVIGITLEFSGEEPLRGVLPPPEIKNAPRY